MLKTLSIRLSRMALFHTICGAVRRAITTPKNGLIKNFSLVSPALNACGLS
jgi:hypothetical protein